MFPDFNLPLRPPTPPTPPPPPTLRPAFQVGSNARPEAAGLPYVNIRQTDAYCTGGNKKDSSRC